MQVRRINIEAVGVEKESSWPSHEVRCTLKRRCVSVWMQNKAYISAPRMERRFECHVSLQCKHDLARKGNEIAAARQRRQSCKGGVNAWIL